MILGKANTEAENIANQYNLVLRSDRFNAISAFERASVSKSNIETETFDIFGESVTASNSLSKYHSNLEYYSSRKEPVFRDFSAAIPKTLYDKFGGMREILEKEEKNAITRLSSQGVFVKENALGKYLLQPYEAIVTAYESIKDVYDTLVEEVKTGISNKKDELIREAENKVTGLSYGMIGNSFDLALYSIDDYRARTRQREKAYTEAKKKTEEFIRQQHSEGNKMYSDFLAKALPYLRQGTDLFIDALCKAENELLAKAGLLDENIESSIDIPKSAQLMERITNNDEDNSFIIALALKKYPCNIAAHTYAIEHGYESQGLIELIYFLGLQTELQHVIYKAERRKEEEKRRKAEEEARRNPEEARRKEEEARRKEEEEAARRKAAEEAAARHKAAEEANLEAHRKAAEEARLNSEEDRRRKEDLERRIAQEKAQQEARRKEAEAWLRNLEEEKRRKAEEEEEEEEARRKAELNLQKEIYAAEQELAAQKDLYEQNRTKLFGSGAKLKKDAAAQIDRLTKLIAELKGQLK